MVLVVSGPGNHGLDVIQGARLNHSASSVPATG